MYGSALVNDSCPFVEIPHTSRKILKDFQNYFGGMGNFLERMFWGSPPNWSPKIYTLAMSFLFRGIPPPPPLAIDIIFAEGGTQILHGLCAGFWNMGGGIFSRFFVKNGKLQRSFEVFFTYF